jgi:hypothetical protein
MSLPADELAEVLEGRMLIACRERLGGFLKHDYAKAA